MFSNGGRDQARDRVVNEMLLLIDNLDLDQARSILRCFSIDEESFDTRALTKVTETVRATCHRSGGDYDASCHFPDAETARVNREHLLNSLSASREAERAKTQQAETAQSTNNENSTTGNSTTEGHPDQQQRGTETRSPAPDLGDPEFEKSETQRLFREGHVTINHYYMNKGPEVQPQPEPAPRPKGHLCALCNEWYFEEDNVLDEDGRPPCGYHSGQVVNYERSLAAAYRNYGYRVTGWAWNCCRRAENEAGCHPEFHRPAQL